MEVIFLIGLFIVVIVAIQTIGDIVKRKYQFENRTEVSQEALAQIQADLNALQKSVNEMKEYLTDLYIQQHDEKLMEG
jgi:competence protein ComGC